MTTERLSGDVRRLIVGNTLSALGTGFTLPFLQIYLSQVRGLPVETAAYAIATLGAVGLLSVPLMGTLTDRFGPWRVLAGAITLEAVGASSLALVTRPWHAFVVLGVLGVGHAAAWPAQAALVAMLVPAVHRPRVYAVQFALLNLGVGIGGAVSGLLVDVDNVRSFQLIYLADACSFLAYGVVLLTLRHVAAPAPAPPAGEGAGGYREILRDRVFLRVCVVILLLSVAGYGQFNVGLPGYATQVAHVSTRTLGLAFAANTAVIVAAQLAVERHLQGRRRSHALAAVAVVWAVSWLVIGSAALAGGTLVPAAAIIAGLALFGFGETLWAPTGTTLVNDLAPPHLRGRYNAMSTLTWQASAVVGPLVAGRMLGADLPGLFIGGLVGLLLVLVVLALRLERHLTPAQNGVPPLDLAEVVVPVR